MQRVKLGGDRLGSGNKMSVELEGYGRSNHNLSYRWRSSMSAGTLVPFMKLVAMPGDTFDIALDAYIQTHPTVGPLFGSFKVQLDVFTIPMRLYNSLLHNNKMKIGLQMNKVYFPIIELSAPFEANADEITDIDNSQINPSCLLAYLGIRGIGINGVEPGITRKFNAVPILAYWEIYKQYYANLMEEVGYVIHNGENAGGAITSISIIDEAGSQTPLPDPLGIYMGSSGYKIQIDWATATAPNLEYIEFQINNGSQLLWVPALDLGINWHEEPNDWWTGNFNAAKYGQVNVYNWRVASTSNSINAAPQLYQFSLENIDEMREELLAYNSMTTPFDISVTNNAPYNYLIDNQAILSSQEGLGVKTYQSDLFNNWLNTEYIDGPNGINEITKIDTTGNEFTIQQFILAKKVYDLLNRIAVSGGSYRDWIQAVYDDNRPWIPETPVYEGGLIKELVFQEVIGQSAAETQPLGTLGGRGVLNDKHKGGRLHIKIAEPSYIMGIASLTPRVEYSQGNDWDVYELQTMDDVHKPGMDEIGFQDLITEQMAWWSTNYIAGTTNDWVQNSAGKQPAWINYMTSVDKVLGNFAIENNEMFMTLNRRYEYDAAGGVIQDLTTYIDPAKYNYIFAQTSLDAQNFWVSIGCKVESRRVMSAKQMPNL